MAPEEEYKHPRIGVGIIVQKKRSILLCMRKGPRGDGHFGLPGGFMEKGESMLQAANRELKQETDLSLPESAPIMVVCGKYQKIHFLDFIYYLNSPTEEPVVKETNRAEYWKYYPIKDLPKPLFRPSEATLDEFLKNYKKIRVDTFLRTKLGFQDTRIPFFDLNEKERIK